jgi:beta-glucosidase
VVVVAAGRRWACPNGSKPAAVLYACYAGQKWAMQWAFSCAIVFQYLSVPQQIEFRLCHYPGEDLHVEYGEGLFVGYRGFDRRKVEPLFPFGHGLSYTAFEYSGLRVSTPTVKADDTVEISIQVRNSGTRAGAEVVQLYLRDVESSLPRPEKELERFRRVVLQPGQTETLTFTLDRAAMSFFDPRKGRWRPNASKSHRIIDHLSQETSTVSMSSAFQTYQRGKSTWPSVN